MRKLLSWSLLSLLLFVGCNRDEPVLPSTPQQVIYPDPNPGEIKGFFLLNEGNMGSNKASLDYFDYATGVYSRNIFAERNPGVVKELGDVGNDIQIYGGRIYAVINCSHFVEVMDAATARHIGTVSIPNCRYIAFAGDFAYVTSYAGPVQIDPNARLGVVVKVDLKSLKVVAECTVGYQPEEMVIAGDKLYVANSGGYRAPDYDRTVSVIDLATFTETKKIDVAINLHRVELDRYGTLWVSSRGDHAGIPSRLYTIDTATDLVTGSFDLPASDMTRNGDRLYVSYAEKGKSTSWVVIDTEKREIVSPDVITDGTDGEITMPYGMAVNPATGEIFVTDARDYVTSGRLHCYSPEGIRKWSVTTGDIPAHIAFTTVALLPIDTPEPPEPPGPSAYITKVLDFMPAPGQFVNRLPEYTEGDTQGAMNAKVLAAIGGDARGLVSLGGWGGYVVVGFDHTIENRSGRCDFRVLGNAFFATGSTTGGSCEPGVIAVAHDANGNGVPDPDEWYEIAGSGHTAPSSEPWWSLAQEAGGDLATIPGHSKTHLRVDYPSGYPGWASGEITFRGTRLPQNGVYQNGVHTLYAFRYGYADNAPNTDDASAIDIDWAVDFDGKSANLSGVDFIRIHTGVDQTNGILGECSTEIAGIEDLHILEIEIPTIITSKKSNR